MEDFATVSIKNYISFDMIFNQENISQLILAVHDFIKNLILNAEAAMLG